jgi:hypothetical protein
MGFMSPNIDSTGRRVRAGIGSVLLVLAAVLFFVGWGWLCLLPALGGVFALFEASRGWCVARACGIKTRV